MFVSLDVGEERRDSTFHVVIRSSSLIVCTVIFVALSQQFPRWTYRRCRRAIAVRRSMSAIGVDGLLMR